MKTIYENESAFGGYGYRVTANKMNAHVSERKNGGSWRIVVRLSRSDFEKWANDVNLYDRYDQNPAKLAKLVSSKKQ